MEYGFDSGRLIAAHDSVSMLRSAATERVRQMLGPEGIVAATPMGLAEMASDVLADLIAPREAKPTLIEQRQILRGIIDTLRAESAPAPAPRTTATG